jgi:pimeloyl-ACP methyl ester carboxylesterase/DNA-binding CsgD family transcriptional regulator
MLESLYPGINVAGDSKMADQELGFCTTTDGVRICYATVGEGPPLVKAPNWLTHLEFEWQSPIWSHWWEELSAHHTLIRFDQRGSGLSDWVVEDLSFDAWVSDLEAVVDALHLETFVLLGISQGGSVAVEYAARHPEKVEKLLLYGAYSRGFLKRGGSVEEHEARVTLTRHGWGRDDPTYRAIFTSGFMPDATAEQASWFNELQRVSTSPENAANIQITLADIDVLDRLPEITAPTLVLHAVGDRRVPYEQGRQLSSLIPNAKLVDLDSKNHLLIETEPAWKTCQAAVREFLGAGPAIETASAAKPADGPAPDGLTPREVEVLRLIANGKSNQDIATELVISVNTVTNHVKNILGKIGCAKRTEAAAYAIPRGIT